jgi:hypothetical protein
MATVVAALAVLLFAMVGVTLAGPSDARSAAADQYVNPTALFTLSLSTSGTGLGTISADGVACSTSCSNQYDEGTVVSVSATADGGSRSSASVSSDSRVDAAVHSRLVGLSGDGCSGGSSCSVVMDSDHAVNADFELTGSTRQGNNSHGGNGGNGGGHHHHGHHSGGHGGSFLGGSSGSGTTGISSGASADQGVLAFTGLNLLLLVIIGLIMLALGTTLLVRDRMAQRAQRTS